LGFKALIGVEMSGIRFDHVALLVRDLDQSVLDYRELLEVLDPDSSGAIVWGEGIEGGFRYRSATFVGAAGNTVIQLIQSENPKDQRLLEKRGECVHHLEFCSTDVKATASKLLEKGVELVSEKPNTSESMPWQQSVVISPARTHGVLVKIATSYRVANGRWVPETPE
jgi:4-hydroxyphenylpyruvate dioxygenase-like putative hemolysin